MRALWVMATYMAISGCTNPTRETTETVFVPEAVEVSKRVLVPVAKELSADLPCYERANDTVLEIEREAKANTATCKTYRANMGAIRNTHPEERP